LKISNVQYSRDIKFKNLMNDLESEKPSAKLIIEKIPHAIPLKNVIINQLLFITKYAYSFGNL
jgi:hypothetical protein